MPETLNATTSEDNPMLQNCDLFSDSGVYADSDESYSREVLFKAWHPEKPLMLAKVSMRVHRLPQNSFARAYVWMEGDGWSAVGSVPTDRWWYSMPGYTRVAQDRTDRQTYSLLDEVAELLAELASVL